MSKENILRITLFVSVLAFNPVAAETLKLKTNIQTQNTTTVKSNIAKILHKRGLDEDVAHEMSENAVLDEKLFAKMLDNLLEGCQNISKDEVLTYLSNEVLFRKDVELDSYDYLVAMVSHIEEKALDKKTLGVLGKVTKYNQQLLA